MAIPKGTQSNKKHLFRYNSNTSRITNAPIITPSICWVPSESTKIYYNWFSNNHGGGGSDN